MHLSNSLVHYKNEGVKCWKGVIWSTRAEEMPTGKNTEILVMLVESSSLKNGTKNVFLVTLVFELL